MGNFKVFSLSGTSSLVVGKGYYEDLSSSAKTTNGVGSAYGDGSYINMSPYQSPVNDPDMQRGDSNINPGSSYQHYNPYYTTPYLQQPDPRFYNYPSRYNQWS
ncbi:hypothetical protein [Litchfieldia salsa]|uniref:hypothetical protein n=1 Tax=Litchfieldia salsa TaxID=930152 RepID=UPI002367DB1E|nr:hypothetical protein [Litchfieldia salsa]